MYFSGYDDRLQDYNDTVDRLDETLRTLSTQVNKLVRSKNVEEYLNDDSGRMFEQLLSI